jgi:hypothetical protein
VRLRARLLVLFLLSAAISASAAAQSDGGVGDAATLTPNARLNARLAPDRRQPELPELTKRNDGSFAFRGNGFDATIERDGTVRMRDRFVRARFGFFRRQNAMTGEWSWSFFEIGFDIFAWLDKKIGKNDPFRSERHWFLAGTFDLRQELATKAAQSRMREALHGIWKRMGLSLSERKRLTFTLWDDSSEDELGAIGRAQVIAFVREHCPQEGARGFSVEDLAALNAKRRRGPAFAPYATP